MEIENFQNNEAENNGSEKISKVLKNYLWEGDMDAADTALQESIDSGVEVDLTFVIKDSIKAVLEDRSASTFEKIDTIADFAKEKGVEMPDLQNLFQEALLDRAKAHPNNIMPFVEAAKTRGIEINLTEIADGQKKLLEEYLGGYDEVQFESAMDVLNFAKEYDIDLGDVKGMIEEMRSSIANTGDKRVIDLNLVLARLQ